MTQTVPSDSRSALERAKFFLAKAKECRVESRQEFEAYLEACIIFGRSAIHRVKSKYQKEAGFRRWWDSLREDPSINFFRQQRDMILKEGPPEIGQIMRMPFVQNTVKIGSEITEDNDDDKTNELVMTSRELAEETYYASDLYFFDDNSVTATETVHNHLTCLEKHINDFIHSLD